MASVRGDYFYNLLIYQDRYMTILKGLGNTLVIAAAAAVIGISLGMLVAMIKYFCKDKKRCARWNGSAICMSRQSAALR